MFVLCAIGCAFKTENILQPASRVNSVTYQGCWRRGEEEEEEEKEEEEEEEEQQQQQQQQQHSQPKKLGCLFLIK